VCAQSVGNRWTSASACPCNSAILRRRVNFMQESKDEGPRERRRRDAAADSSHPGEQVLPVNRLCATETDIGRAHSGCLYTGSGPRATETVARPCKNHPREQRRRSVGGSTCRKFPWDLVAGYYYYYYYYYFCCVERAIFTVL